MVSCPPVAAAPIPASGRSSLGNQSQDHPSPPPRHLGSGSTLRRSRKDRQSDREHAAPVSKPPLPCAPSPPPSARPTAARESHSTTSRRLSRTAPIPDSSMAESGSFSDDLVQSIRVLQSERRRLTPERPLREHLARDQNSLPSTTDGVSGAETDSVAGADNSLPEEVSFVGQAEVCCCRLGHRVCHPEQLPGHFCLWFCVWVRNSMGSVGRFVCAPVTFV